MPATYAGGGNACGCARPPRECLRPPERCRSPSASPRVRGEGGAWEVIPPHRRAATGRSARLRDAGALGRPRGPRLGELNLAFRALATPV